MTTLNKIFAFLYPITGIIFIIRDWMENSREFSHNPLLPIIIFLILAWAIYFVSKLYWKLAKTPTAHGRKFMPIIGILILSCVIIVSIISAVTTDFGGMLAIPFVILALTLLVVTFVSAIVLRIWNSKIQ